MLIFDDIKINVCIFAFDLLHLNSQSLLQEELGVCRTHLLDSFDEDVGYLEFATPLTSKNRELLQIFLEQSASASCEGLIFKPLGVNSKYEPGKRNWLKLKKDFIESVYGKFLLACYDPDTEEFQTICKAGAGLSDEMLDDCHDRFASKVIANPMPSYKYNADMLQPDVWFEPSEVWEVKAGGLTISPVYSAAAGLVEPFQGLSLRNPVVMRVRTDKILTMASTAEQVAEMYLNNSENNHGVHASKMKATTTQVHCT